MAQWVECPSWAQVMTSRVGLVGLRHPLCPFPTGTLSFSKINIKKIKKLKKIVMPWTPLAVDEVCGPLFRITFYNVLPRMWLLLWLEQCDFLCLPTNNVCVCRLWVVFPPQLCSHNVFLDMLSIFVERKCTKPARVIYYVCLPLPPNSVYKMGIEEETKSRKEPLLLRTCSTHGPYHCTICEC